MTTVSHRVAVRPLEGRTIVVTRAAAQARRFTALLEAAGARVLEIPTIVIAPPPSWDPLDRALDRLSEFDWIAFTSVNGVTMVDRRLRERAQAWSEIAQRKVAAIGPATATALRGRGVRPAAVPTEYRAEALVECLRHDLGPGDRVLLPRAAETRDVLVTELGKLGVSVTEVPAYVTRPAGEAVDRLRIALAAGEVDAITFTSSSTVRHCAEVFTEGERRLHFRGVTIAAIGPVTAATAAHYGLTTHVMPREYTIPALARAIADHFAGPPAPGRPEEEE